jgi:hypothetical protein
VKLELLTALTVEITVLWNVMKPSGSAYFSGMKMETVGFYLTLVI